MFGIIRKDKVRNEEVMEITSLQKLELIIKETRLRWLMGSHGLQAITGNWAGMSSVAAQDYIIEEHS